MHAYAPATVRGRRQPTPRVAVPARNDEARVPRLVAGAGAVALIIAAAFLPIWQARLMAPQYPGGLRISVSGDGLRGDVAEINELNHYIGLRPLDVHAAPELALWLPALGVALAIVVVASLARRRLVVRLARLASWAVVPGILADIQFRLWQLGRDLDPDAALRVDPFTPWVVGPTTVWNFRTWAFPGPALLALFTAAAVITFGPRLLGKLSAVRRRRGSRAVAAAVLVLLVVAGGSASAQTHQHDTLDSGSTHPVPPAHYGIRTIQRRIAAARPGDSIDVSPGQYHGRLVVDRPLRLVARGRVTIVGPGTGDAVVIRAANVTLRGFEIVGVAAGPVGGPSGIRVEGPGATIQDVIIRAAYHGIAAVGVEDLRIERVTITGRGGSIGSDAHATDPAAHAEAAESLRGDGISLMQARRVLVRGVVIHHARDGIYLSSAHEVLIDSNSVHHSRYGVHAMFATDYTLAENVFAGNMAGAVLMYGRKVFFLRNDLSRNGSPSTGFGLITKDVDDFRAVENRLVANRVGVQIDGPPASDPERTMLLGNTIARNAIGAALMPTASATFTRNSFIENLVQVSPLGGVSTSRWASKGAGNHWTSYRGFDRRADGIGDVAHLEAPAAADAISRAPMLGALASSPGFQLLAGLRSRWSTEKPVLIDELPLVRPWSQIHDAPVHAHAASHVSPTVPAAAAFVALGAAAALARARRPLRPGAASRTLRGRHVFA